MKPWEMVRRFGASAAPAGRRWWRISVTANHGYTGAQFMEIEMRAVVGGADLTTPADALSRAFASSVYGTYVAAKAFDDDPATAWFTNLDPSPSNPRRIGYRFDLPVVINEVKLLPVPTGSELSIAPKDFSIESSENSTDGTDGTWSVEWSVAGQPAWSYDEARVFARP